jgi:hypothetical protein
MYFVGLGIGVCSRRNKDREKWKRLRRRPGTRRGLAPYMEYNFAGLLGIGTP